MTQNTELKEVTETNPCIHCGKDSWCYSLGELSACKRGAEPADGWVLTNKQDKEGTPYYAPTLSRKAVRPKNRKEYFYPDREGNPLVRVVRIDDGEGKKSFPQSHWDGKGWPKGVPDEIRDQIPIYRYQDVRRAISGGRPIYVVEGEGVADVLWSAGLAATTTLGGSGKYRSYGNYARDLEDAQLILCPDRDEPGMKHMEEISHDFPTAKWLYAPPGDWNWQHLPKSGGLDVGDWLSNGATVDDVKSAVGEKQFGLPQTPYVEVTTDMDDFNAIALEKELLTVPPADEVFTQKAMDALYGDGRWISVDGHLYQWTGTHYKIVSTPVEKARIAKWCNSTPVQASNNRWQYSYAKSQYVENIWNWVLIQVAVDPELLNPPGLNCLNGVLQISWKGNQPSWQIVSHEPTLLYTYVGEFEFNPNADPSSCDRLLECLEVGQRDIFIKTLASSLDLPTIRRFKSRIRALLCKGDGNNGKDSLREAVQLLYGVGVVSTTFNDFHQYENNGRKFPLAKLDQARVSWSSENSNVSQLDKLQCLKAAITGETLDMELKNTTERPMRPRCIFLFNINDVPNMQAALEAIQSRWAVLSFDKTFKVGADSSRGEIEADPRFRYDPEFLQREVVPALLNKMLAALSEVATKMIDYTCTNHVLLEVQRETNHLRAFCQDVGLDYQAGARLYANEIWRVLREWYIDNGTLVITMDDRGKEKKQWNEQARARDKNVTGENQVLRRFQEIFPKAQYLDGKQAPRERRGQASLAEIGFVEAVVEPNVEPNVEPKILAPWECEACRANLATLAQNSSKPRSTKLAERIKNEMIQAQSLTELQSLQDFYPNSEMNWVVVNLMNDSEWSNIRKLARHASHPCPEATSASTTGSTTASTTGSTTASTQTESPAFAIGSAASGSGSVQIGNTTKNFASNPTSLRLTVGTKCKAAHPGIWGIRDNTVLTIKSIDGEIATVTYDGCRSVTGSEVLLSDLIPVELEG